MSVGVTINASSPNPVDKNSETEDNNVFGTWKVRKQSVVSSSMADEEQKPSASSLLRRRSTFKGIATGLLSMRRMTKGRLMSDAAAELKSKPIIKMENTYKTEPDEGKQFIFKRVEDAVTSILEKELCNEKYNEVRCKNLTCDLAVIIKNKVKAMGFPRYKIISNVVIGQCQDQGLEMASQCVWSPSTDNYSCASYKNSSLFAVATVHAVYYE